MIQILEVQLQAEVGGDGSPLWTASTNRFHLGDHHATAYAQSTDPLLAISELAAELVRITEAQRPKPDTIKASPLERVPDDG